MVGWGPVQQAFSQLPFRHGPTGTLAARASPAIEAMTAGFVTPVFATRIQELGTTMTGSTDTGLFTARNMTRAGICAVAALALAGCGGKKETRGVMAPSQVTTIGVNSYLWRASLDTLSFMPLLQSDSAGGVIVTDWYTNPKNPGERMKVTVMILDRVDFFDPLVVESGKIRGKFLAIPDDLYPGGVIRHGYFVNQLSMTDSLRMIVWSRSGPVEMRPISTPI